MLVLSAIFLNGGFMPNDQFVWYELATTDRIAAKAFYSEVMGWGIREMTTPVSYTLFTVAEIPVCGLMDLLEGATKKGAKPRWLGYIGVDDVDARVEHISRLGGAVLVPPAELANLSCFAVVADPQMASFALIAWPKGRNSETEPGAQGRVGWRELLAADLDKALSFYGELFGWRRADVKVGARGSYRFFATGQQAIGGMVNKPRTVPVPSWVYYFNVDDIESAAKRVRQHGGQILEGPIEAVNCSWTLKCTDPQGAMFALVGKRPYKAIIRFKPIATRNTPARKLRPKGP